VPITRPSRSGIRWPGLVIRLRTSAALAKRRIAEVLSFDLPWLMHLYSLATFGLGAAADVVGRYSTAFTWYSRAHTATSLPMVARAIERRLSPQVPPAKGTPRFAGVIAGHVRSLRPRPNTERFFADPRKLLGPMAIVLKHRSASERGVLVICYSHAFPLFARLFDVDRVTAHYYIVLEPSWTGFCNLDDLAFLHARQPVFVQAYEPRDRAFVDRLRSNLVPIPIASNWWVDHRVFRPLPGTAKDLDIVMVAGWADFKRHYRLFAALRSANRRGVRLRAALIGYPMHNTQHDVLALAAHYGVVDQLEVYEGIAHEEINRHLNRAKVNLVWSRREGVNRAIVEGFFAGTPCLVRSGFNYGYAYPYVNSATGRFAREDELADSLVWFRDNYDRFEPRSWAERHMTCQDAATIAGRSIGEVATRLGESWTGQLTVKVNSLGGMHYWDPNERQRFDADYEFLASCARRRPDDQPLRVDP
jgi:glycosyltransferase involved in cell wall biosynthesis